MDMRNAEMNNRLFMLNRNFIRSENCPKEMYYINKMMVSVIQLTQSSE